LNFLNDSGYYLHGIGTKGIHPEAP